MSRMKPQSQTAEGEVNMSRCDFSCGAESNRHSGAVGAEKRAEQSNPGGGHEVTGQDIEKLYEQKPSGMNPRPEGASLRQTPRETAATQER